MKISQRGTMERPCYAILCIQALYIYDTAKYINLKFKLAVVSHAAAGPRSCCSFECGRSLIGRFTMLEPNLFCLASLVLEDCV